MFRQCFERHGDRDVFRPTLFSAGFEITRDEKERLAAGLRRLTWRMAVAGLVAFVPIIGVIVLGDLSRHGAAWMVVLIAAMLAILSVDSVSWRDRLVRRVLPGRAPDVRRLPIWTAWWRPRYCVAPRYLVSTVRLGLGLIVLVWLAGDGIAVVPLVAGLRAGPDGIELLSLTLYNKGFWAIVAMFNAVMATVLTALLLWRRELRPPDQL